MRVKSMFLVIVLNIFLMLFVSLMLEYLKLDERFNQLTNNISVCAEMTLSTVTASEEMFSEDYNDHMISYASRYGNKNAHVSSKTLLFLKNGSGYVLKPVNSYVLAMYWASHGNSFPSSLSTYNTYENERKSKAGGITGETYRFIYGGTSCDYNNASLKSWANTNRSKLADANDINSMFGLFDRKPTTEFKNFYNGIGKDVMTVGFVKHKSGSNEFTVSEDTYPVLLNMGLELDGMNSVGSSSTADNFTSSVHAGKQFKSKYTGGVTGNQFSYYYLTPSSLGVTYIPRDVFIPVFNANLDTMVRLQKVSGGVTSELSAEDFAKTLASATGCVNTGIYDYGNNDHGILNLLNTSGQIHPVDSSTHEIKHKNSSSSIIVNDGTTEYDLSSTQVKVDYFYVDFNEGATSRLAAKLNGLLTDTTGKPSLNYTRSQFISSANDTGTKAGMSGYDDVRTKRLVARVQVKMKVHVLYQSQLLQWLCYRNGTSPHFDIKAYSPKDGKAYQDEDGVWYQTTLYYCQSR